jgi:prephenate dehydrogenase
MTPYSTPEEEFSHAVYLLSQVKQTLSRIAFKDPDMWDKFARRLNEAGAGIIENLAAECDLISLLITQDAGGILGVSFSQSSEMVQ